MCSVFSVPNGECVFRLHPRFSYSYDHCENPFFAHEKTIHAALRFSQSLQLLLVASQVWSESTGTAVGECALSQTVRTD